MKQKRRYNAVVPILCVAMAFLILGQMWSRRTDENPVAVMTMALTDLALPVVAASDRFEQSDPVSDIEATDPAQKEDEPVTGGEEDAEGGLPQEMETAETDEIQIQDSVKPPQVLIYHTHTTESYQPVTEGNFHSVEKTGTVREVGDSMAQRLTELGFEVIHDETIHDNPSYNQSYSRSLETAKQYLDRYPGIRLVVDLHRDAAGYAGSVGKTVSVSGKNAAAYGYVIGQGNPNVAELTETVDQLNRAAEQRYPGFTGKIIEKAYKFNQYISDHHVLVEVGNNENTIEQAKLTGYYLAEIFADYLNQQ